MKNKYWLFFFIFSIVGVEGFAQPGNRIVRQNLNDYTFNQIESIKKSKNNLEFIFIIDSATRLERVEHLKAFKTLNLEINFRKIPEAFKNVKFDSLTSLTISSFSSVLEDISGIENYVALEKLRIYRTAIKALPENISSMKALSEIHFYQNDQLINLDGIGKLQNLKRLYVGSSAALKRIDVDLSSTRLEYINFLQLFHLVDINGIITCKSLKEFVLNGVGIKSIPQKFSHLAKLERLEIKDNYHLNDISEIKNLRKLEEITLHRSNSIKSFSNLFTNTQLKTVDIISDSLTSLSGIEKLTKITYLSVYSKSNDFFLPKRFYLLKNLERFVLYASSKDISMVKQLPKLKFLSLSSLNINKLPKTIYNNPDLEELTISYSHILDLTSLSNLKKNKKIKKLHVTYNDKLIKMPPSSAFVNLERLDLLNNPRLRLDTGYYRKQNEYLWEIRYNGDFYDE